MNIRKNSLTLIVLAGISLGGVSQAAQAPKSDLAQSKSIVLRIEQQLDRFAQLNEKEIASIDADLRRLDQGVELRGNMRDKVTRLQKRFMDLQAKREYHAAPVSSVKKEDAIKKEPTIYKDSTDENEDLQAAIAESLKTSKTSEKPAGTYDAAIPGGSSIETEDTPPAYDDWSN